MTPKEKAKDLVVKMMDKSPSILIKDRQSAFTLAHIHALIAVEEILKMKKEFWDDLQSEYFDWWKQVKNEIEKL